jgi:hypothetical protein
MFSPPADTTPYQPAANSATLTGPTPIPGLPNVNQWQVTPTDSPPTPPFVYKCSNKFSADLAAWNARLEIAQNLKFFPQTGTDMLDPTDNEKASLWFAQNVLKPFWLPIKPAS